MVEQGTGQPEDGKAFTLKLDEVVETEKEYLDERREKNELPPIGDDAPLWGLAFSGGGVRSATFCLGVMQALTGRGRMKRFDYLSTVSGGGYIGSCLSSLLSGRNDTGLDRENSPFVGLREQDSYGSPAQTKLSVRHQIHHLRTHGEYLIPRSRLLSRDVQRAVGSVVSGMVHTITLFVLIFVVLVAATHFTLTFIEPDLSTLAKTDNLNLDPNHEMNPLEYVKAVSEAWFGQRILPPFRTLLGEAKDYWKMLALLLIPGGLWSLGVVVLATRLASTFEAVRFASANNIPAGWTAEELREARFVRRFNFASLSLGIVVMMGLAAWCRTVDGKSEFLAALLVPLALAVAGFWVSHVTTYVWSSWLRLRSWIGGAQSRENRFRRSLYASVRGASIYGLIAAASVPVVLIVLFSLATLPMKFFWSLASLAVAYYASRQAGDPSAMQLGGWLKRPISNIALLLFLALVFAEISSVLLKLYRTKPVIFEIWQWSLMIGGGCLVLFLVFSLLIDANRISPHYFYRDRLTEAYLKTDARVTRLKVSDHQGMPLRVIRDDEDLELSDLGKGNGRGPYHLIVAAMNLSGSNELNRKSFLSEHFIFSRDYIGSRITGWVPTERYRCGSTRLARAMTISAAAVGSAMGPNTFAAQAFVTTLFNVRLGYWTENPWKYRECDPDDRRSRPTFWPKYLFYELLGKADASQPMVNVSDGGHTGDNVALLPLLQRRCETIVVCDAEADGGLTFGSFNNAVRMAFTEENIEIVIDLTEVMDREETEAGFTASAANVVEGEIRYPKTATQEAFTGRLVYIKSSIPRENVPVHVANYAKGNQEFPHETTADQFFDDAQFEAYRALGHKLGDVAVRVLG
jgi:hypothetical protein